MASSQPAAALAQDIARTDLVHDLVTQAPSNKGDDATLALMPLKNTADGNSKGDVDKTAVEIEDGTNGEASGDTVAPPVEEPIPPHWKTNVALFFAAFFFGYLTQFIHVTATTVIAREFAGNNLATLPGGFLFIGSMASAFPLSILGEKIGLKYSYFAGTTLGIFGGVLAFLAVVYQSFALLCIGMLFQGSQNATTQLVRYGVRAVAPAAYRNRALSWTVAGAILAAPFGPIIAKNTIYLIPSIKYGGIYILVIAIIIAMDICILFVRFPPMPKVVKPVTPEIGTAAPAETPRGEVIRHFMKNRKFLIAIIAGATAQCLMVLMMAPVPLAILGAGYTFDDQANVLLGHILGMFFPSLFVGNAIDKFGYIPVNLTGMLLLGISAGILMIGESLPIYYVGETLQGIGWNLSFISATAIILKMCAPGRELQTIQGLNDTISQTIGGIFGVISGPLYNAMGWRPLMGLSLGILGLSTAGIIVVAKAPLPGMRHGEQGLATFTKDNKEEQERLEKDFAAAKLAVDAEHEHAK